MFLPMKEQGILTPEAKVPQVAIEPPSPTYFKANYVSFYAKWASCNQSYRHKLWLTTADPYVNLCVDQETIKSLVYHESDHSSSQLDSRYGTARETYSQHVSSVMCGISPSPLVWEVFELGIRSCERWKRWCRRIFELQSISGWKIVSDNLEKHSLLQSRTESWWWKIKWWWRSRITKACPGV